MQRFYSEDELYAHCRDRHERCHICDRRNQGRQQQYFRDYDALEEHFRSDHFLCADQECLDKKFVVFDSEMDLKAHQLETHPNGLSKDARRDARRVDMSGFDYRTPRPDDRGNRRDRDGRGRGRGRDPNTEPLPMSTAQPLRRDELAYQRQMALQGSRPVSSGGDSSFNRAPARHQDRNSSVQHAGTASGVSPAMERLQVDTPQVSNEPATLQEQARSMQHAGVVERAASMLDGDITKTSDFRNTVSAYKLSKIGAQQLIETFFTLFDVPSAELGKLIKELAELYDKEAKRADLLKAWNDWRAINEDYPSLPGPSGVLPGSSAATAGSGGKRVLKLKSSTAQSSRSAVSKQGSWGRGLVSSNPSGAAASSTSRAGVAGAAVSPVFPSGTPRGNAPAWVSDAPSSASNRIPSSPTPKVSSTSRIAPVPSAEAFPALPAAAKPNTLMMGLTRGTVRWDDRRSGSTPVSNPWGASGKSTSSNANDTSVQPANNFNVDDNADSTAGRKKGNKNKKQTLYKFG